RLCRDAKALPTAAELADALRPELLHAFPAALLGRLATVPYYPISDQVIQQIIRLQLDRIVRRVQQNHRAQLTYSDDLVAHIAERCREVESGARSVDHILTRTLLPELSQEFLTRMAQGQAISRVHVTVNDKNAFQYEVV